jgi:starch-binding outer membrane protein, SusD/RagB family
MKNIKIYFILFLFFGIFSCADLDLQPTESISETAVWKDINLIELYVNDRYRELPHGFTRWAGGLRFTGITDESYHMHEPHHLDKFTKGELDSGSLSNYYWGGFWLEAYTAIRNENIFIEKIQGFSGSEADQKRIKLLKAEIRFLRAFFYTELLSRYGEVPLIKKSFDLNSNFDVPRTSVTECVDFITQELDLAIADLPNKSESMGQNFGRVTKGAAIGLKIKALMYNASPLFNSANEVARWKKVSDACEQLFALNQYTLSNDYKGLFLNAKDAEIIFFKQFSGQYGPLDAVDILSDFYYHPDYSGGQAIDQWRFPNGDGGWVSENPRQDFVDEYETLTGKIPVTGYGGSDSKNLQPIRNPAVTLSEYNPLKPYEKRDPRLEYSIFHDDSDFKGRKLEFWAGGKDSRTAIDNANNGSQLGYGIRKSLEEKWSTQSTVFGGNQPWIYMRLAEFYLTYAEAQFHLGFPNTAVEYVNKIRSRTGISMPAINASGDVLTKIKHERKIELAFEGNRWYDARRWKDAEKDFAKDMVGVEVIKDKSTGAKSYRYFYFDGSKGKRSFPTSHYLFPIPIEELRKSKLTQNEGYN